MDYFGGLVDELTEMQERIETSPHAAEASSVLKALHRAMMAALAVERQRYSREREKSMMAPASAAAAEHDGLHSRAA
jgi:hypothetical protein